MADIPTAVWPALSAVLVALVGTIGAVLVARINKPDQPQNRRAATTNAKLDEALDELAGIHSTLDRVHRISVDERMAILRRVARVEFLVSGKEPPP